MDEEMINFFTKEFGLSKKDNLMYFACYKGDVEIVKNLVETKYPYESYNEEALNITCKANQLEVLKYFVNESGLPDDFFNKANDPFYYAFMYGNLELKKFMCQSKKMVDFFHKSRDIYEDHYNNIFIYACSHSDKNLELIKYLVENAIFPIEYCMTIDTESYINIYNVRITTKRTAFTECTIKSGEDIEKNEVLNYLLNSNKFPDSFFKIDETYFWKDIENPNFENDFAFVKKHPRFQGNF
jgi:hypothetical protein